jgi:UDP-N-acetylmuramate dehydrogenase
MNCPKSLRKKCKENEPLARHTTFGSGGPAELFVRVPHCAGLKAALKAARTVKARCRVIGAGSNILALDAGVEGMVLKLDSACFRKISLRGTRATVGAGASLASLVQACSRRGLSGLEFLAGIPGTVGGGLAMNCGVSRAGVRLSIADRVEEIDVMDYNGRRSALPRRGLRFGYRSSGLSRYIILSATFRLQKASRAAVKNTVHASLAARSGQDYRFPSAGCVFRNPHGKSAGRLIDSCGLKARRAGGARISERHANFIVNTGRASARDVLALMELAKKKVRERFGITLVPEIKIWK